MESIPELGRIWKRWERVKEPRRPEKPVGHNIALRQQEASPLRVATGRDASWLLEARRLRSPPAENPAATMGGQQRKAVS